jgi:hypothetical protein
MIYKIFGKTFIKKGDPELKYEVGEEVGGGSIATIFKVKRLSDGEFFAMKTIKYVELELTEFEK